MILVELLLVFIAGMLIAVLVSIHSAVVRIEWVIKNLASKK